MKLTLYLMRHAKSSWKDDAITDRARPLNKRGKRDAPRMGRALSKRAPHIDLALCSDAVRARQTLDGVVQGWSGTLRAVRFEPTLYHADVDAARALLTALDDTHERKVLVVGHNPGHEELLEFLCGESHELTTANVAILTCEMASWQEAMEQHGAWSLEALLRPKELDD